MDDPKNMAVQGDHIDGDKVGGNKTVYNITQVIHMAAYQPPPDLQALGDAYLAHRQI